MLLFGALCRDLETKHVVGRDILFESGIFISIACESLVFRLETSKQKLTFTEINADLDGHVLIIETGGSVEQSTGIARIYETTSIDERSVVCTRWKLWLRSFHKKRAGINTCEDGGYCRSNNVCLGVQHLDWRYYHPMYSECIA
jgi:hypothetical protein